MLHFEQVLLGQRLSGRDVHAGPGCCQSVTTVSRGHHVTADPPAASLPVVEAPRAFSNRPARGQLGLMQPRQPRFLHAIHTHTPALLDRTPAELTKISDQRVACAAAIIDDHCTNRICERPREYWALQRAARPSMTDGTSKPSEGRSTGHTDVDHRDQANTCSLAPQTTISRPTFNVSIFQHTEITQKYTIITVFVTYNNRPNNS